MRSENYSLKILTAQSPLIDWMRQKGLSRQTLAGFEKLLSKISECASSSEEWVWSKAHLTRNADAFHDNYKDTNWVQWKAHFTQAFCDIRKMSYSKFLAAWPPVTIWMWLNEFHVKCLRDQSNCSAKCLTAQISFTNSMPSKAHSTRNTDALPSAQKGNHK